MKRHYALLLNLVLIAVIYASETPGQLSFDYLTNDNGLPHNRIYDICQDDRGYMWFATDGGLVRYDGRQTVVYRHDRAATSLCSNSVSRLLFTSDGRLYIGTADGISLYYPEMNTFASIGSKAWGGIENLVEGNGQKILVSTFENGCFSYDTRTGAIRKIPILDSDPVWIGCRDKEGSYWAYTRLKLFRFDDNMEIKEEYRVSPELFGSSAISLIYPDSQGNIWIGTFEKGIFKYDARRKTFVPVRLTPDNRKKESPLGLIRTMTEADGKDEYWIGSENGLFLINVRTGNYTRYCQSFESTGKTINDNAVYKVFKSRQGIYWIGTYFGGVNILNVRNNGFHVLEPSDQPNGLKGKALSQIVPYGQDRLLIATEDAGIAILDRNDYRTTHLTADKNDPHRIPSDNVHALLPVSENEVWSGNFLGGISRIDMRSHTARTYRSQEGLTSDFVFSLFELSPDTLLIGELIGADLYDKKNNRFTKFRPDLFEGAFVYGIFRDPEGPVWIYTHNKGIFQYEPAGKTFTHFCYGDRSGLPSNSIVAHCIGSDRRIWFGTKDAGLCRYNREDSTFTVFNESGLLSDNGIRGILEDGHGNLWISSDVGISKINFSDSTAVHYNSKHGLSNNQFNYNSYCRTDDGWMYFGSINGLTYFHPDSIHIEEEAPNLSITYFKLGNTVISPTTNRLLNKQIDYTKRIVLAHDQNSFSIGFSGIYFYKGDVSYQYFLEGLDKEWSMAMDKGEANYTNLSPGHYTFYVKATSRINNMTGETRKIEIIVKPPFWATYTAYFVYAVVLILSVYILYLCYNRRQKRKLAAAIEKIELENVQKLNQHKLNFFTYISHEFKTPLTIIMASIEALRQDRPEEKEKSAFYETIWYSATRLLILVGQLMEFRKIESDHVTLHIRQGSAADFVSLVTRSFRPLLEKKKIRLHTCIGGKTDSFAFDFDKLEKILTNLLMNAIVHTPSEGEITVDFQVAESLLQLAVQDSGKGIDPSLKDNIFEIFSSDKAAYGFAKGSGIGLALVQSLVKFLKGNIEVNNSEQGGCIFKVSLPLTCSSGPFDPYQSRIPENQLFYTDESGSGLSYQDVPTVNKPEHTYTLAIVEDDKDLLGLLNRHFSRTYKVCTFPDAEKAWKNIREKAPDIILIDMMLPGMNGSELCRMIKNEANICHIPVVMMTARDGDEAKLESLESGADIYIQKPFKLAEIDAQIKNIIQSRAALRKWFSEIGNTEIVKRDIKNADEVFLKKAIALIENNIEDTDFDVSGLIGELGISRTQLHNRIKSILGVTTTEFINKVRIKKAKELIASHPELTFSEIAYKTGFSDLSGFSRMFKKVTGITPSQYKTEKG